MKSRKRIRTRGLALATMTVLAVPLLLLGYYEKVHRWAAEQALVLLEKNDRGRMYAEVYAQANKDMIVAGSWMEDFGGVDGNERSFRHYYDPTTGLGPAFQPYFHVWIVLEGASVTFRGLRYPGALQWAKDGAGTKDVRNWKGAIEAYDYSALSRSEAYFRLGHVVHLIADMAEPDHATNTIHAASGFYYPKDLNKILTHLRAAAESVPGFKDWQERLEAMIAINAAVGEQRVGFEEHIERSPQELSLSPSAVKVNKFLSLDSYFNTMGRLSKDAIQNKFPLPIGVRLTPDTTEAEQAGLAALRANYSFFPAIDFKDPAEAEKYFKLARELLTSSVRLNWGVLEFFHDLVNPPPYVRSVEVKQGGRPCYSATWVDITDTVSGVHPNDNEKAAEKLAAGRFYHRFRYEKVLRRELREQKGNQPLRPGVEAEVRLYFGPDPQGFAAQTERVKTVSVSVGGEPVSGRVIDDGTAWVGRFTPDLGEGEEERELQVEIEAVDAHAHSVIPGRQAFPRREALEREAGYRLDSEPDSPAKTDSDPPYHVRNYEPGADLNHKVMVRAVAERPEDRAESSPWLNFEVAGDVVRPARDSAWSFNLNLNTTTDVWPELIEKEEWKFFPGGQWPSTYSRTVKEKGRAQQFFAPDITGLARPPEGRLQKGGEAEYELNLFDVDAQGRFKSGSAQRSGNRIFHFFWITGKADPFVYKVRFKGRGRDGKVHQAEFVFDSREWVPAGKDSAGQTVYRKK